MGNGVNPAVATAVARRAAVPGAPAAPRPSIAKVTDPSMSIQTEPIGSIVASPALPRAMPKGPA